MDYLVGALNMPHIIRKVLWARIFICPFFGKVNKFKYFFVEDDKLRTSVDILLQLIEMNMKQRIFKSK